MDERSGRRLGPYEVGDVIGSGGSSVVYRARRRGQREDLALKVLETASDQDARRLAAIARQAAVLRHPNIVSAFEAGTEGGLAFAAMPLVGGPALRDLLEQKGRLEAPKASAVLGAAAAALDYAHSTGQAHGGLKPENILIGASGRVFLVDFGLADPDGPRAYRAPEALEGEPSSADDLFALGVMAYEMLLGSLPSRKTPEAAPELLAVLKRQVSRSPARRFRTGEAFVAALAGALGEAIAAEPPQANTPELGLAFPNAEAEAQPHPTEQATQHAVVSRPPGRSRRPNRAATAIPPALDLEGAAGIRPDSRLHAEGDPVKSQFTAPPPKLDGAEAEQILEEAAPAGGYDPVVIGVFVVCFALVMLWFFLAR